MLIGDQFTTFEGLRDAVHLKAKVEFFVPILKNTKKHASEYLNGSFRCSMSGNYRGTKTNAPTTKTACQWHITFNKLASGVYHVTKLRLEHNHPLEPESIKFLAPLNFKCSAEALNRLQFFRSINIPIRTLVNMMEREGIAASSSQVSRMGSKKKDELESLANLFEFDPTWKIMTHCDGSSSQPAQLNAIFLTRTSQLKTFQNCPELLEVDCTYNTNRHRMPLCVLVGIDQHKKTFIAGMALLRQETSDYYEWIFYALLQLSGLAPNCVKTIITDNDAALSNAIQTIFDDGTRHQICAYHIEINFRSRFRGPLNTKAYEAAKDLLWRIICSPSEPELGENMSQMSRQFPAVHRYLEDNWFPLKNKWCKAYIKKNINFGHSTTARVEGIHRSLKLDARTQMRLDGLVMALERKLIREQEARERLDYMSRISVDYNPPPILAPLCGRICSYAYWRLIDLYKRSANMMCHALQLSDAEPAFKVQDFTVTMVGIRMECTCCDFVQNLLPCVHIVCVCSHSHIRLLPWMIHQRWRYFLGLSSLLDEEINEEEEESGLKDLFDQPVVQQPEQITGEVMPSDSPVPKPSATISEPASLDVDVAELLMSLNSIYLSMPKEEAINHIRKSIGDLSKDDSQGSQTKALRTCAVPEINPRGRPASSRRIKPISETSGGRKCGNCHQMGHNRKTCPRKDPEQAE
jgi:hypothetical protein